jgi:hypothetical protein
MGEKWVKVLLFKLLWAWFFPVFVRSLFAGKNRVLSLGASATGGGFAWHYI